MIPILAFDIYGTLIDPYSMEQHLQPALGSKAKDAVVVWRNKQIEFSFRRAHRSHISMLQLGNVLGTTHYWAESRAQPSCHHRPVKSS